MFRVRDLVNCCCYSPLTTHHLPVSTHYLLTTDHLLLTCYLLLTTLPLTTLLLYYRRPRRGRHLGPLVRRRGAGRTQRAAGDAYPAGGHTKCSRSKCSLAHAARTRRARGAHAARCLLQGCIAYSPTHKLTHQESIAFGRELPWRNMTIIVDPTAFSARPAHAIEAAVRAARARDGGAWLTRALALRARHAPDVLWSHPRSRVTDRVLNACARVSDSEIRSGTSRAANFLGRFKGVAGHFV